ncbi:MAG: sarcosine oxidase subunit gamma [Paracoccaceae bacterium]
MADLIAISPCAGLLPFTIRGLSLIELTPAAITSVAPAKGQGRAVSAALRASGGPGFPAANRAPGNDEARCIWFGADLAMLLGEPPKAVKGAALSDQSDGWAVMRLQGARAEAVLARLVPVDLRAAVFGRNHTARTLLHHMPASISRTGKDSFDIMVMRSMATTAVHELKGAMRSVSAQDL